jgi:hypothetical protein
MKINKYSLIFTIFSIILITYIIYNTLFSKKTIIEPHSNISSTPTLLTDDNYYTSTPGLWDKNKTKPLIGGQKFYNVNITIKDGDALVDSVESPGSSLADVGAGAGADIGAGAGADNEASDRNWELYSNKTYMYTGGEIQNDINNSYNCRKRCNTNTDGTENKKCKAYLFNEANSVTFGSDSCKLINENISDNTDKLKEDANGGLIYKKTNEYQHISTTSTYSTESITPMNFGNFSNLVKCKNLKGATVCEGEACKNYVPTEVITCKSQTNELTTSSNQYDCERNVNGDCINKYENARKEAERLAEIERKIKQEAEILAQKEKAAKNEAQRLAAKKEKEQKEQQARVAEKKRKASEEAAEKLRQEEEEAARVEAARVEAARVEAARVEAVRVEAARVEAAKVEAQRLAKLKGKKSIIKWQDVTNWKFCSWEGKQCKNNTTEDQFIKYGTRYKKGKTCKGMEEKGNECYNYYKISPGSSIKCNNSKGDPVRGIKKQCWISQ